MAKNRNQWRTAYNRPPKGEKQKDCPLIEIPPHGRLIDADALVRDNGIKEIPEYYEIVCDAPTIIPADKEENG